MKKTALKLSLRPDNDSSSNEDQTSNSSGTGPKITLKLKESPNSTKKLDLSKIKLK